MLMSDAADQGHKGYSYSFLIIVAYLDWFAFLFVSLTFADSNWIVLLVYNFVKFI